jgi:hypothetical protein
MIWPLLILLSSLTFAAPRTCLTNSLIALSDHKPFPKKSLADGSDILNIHTYLEGVSQNPKWKRFADYVQKSRDDYAPKFGYKKKMALINDRRLPAYGYDRMRRDAQNLPGKTLEAAFQKFNPGKDYELVQDGTKVIISPKNKVLGRDYVEIRYDISGNYFRLQRGKYLGERFLRFVSERKQFIDWEGNIINTEGKLSPDKFQALMQKSHWNALID